MKLSELILELAKLQVAYGDISCFIDQMPLLNKDIHGGDAADLLEVFINTKEVEWRDNIHVPICYLGRK